MVVKAYDQKKDKIDSNNNEKLGDKSNGIYEYQIITRNLGLDTKVSTNINIFPQFFLEEKL
jgi:hypothetical protein